MGEPKPTREQIDAWRRQAQSDLRNARRNAEIGAHDVCVLLCQQAMEKMLKAAYMAVRGREAPFTHNLAVLLRALESPAEVLRNSTASTTDYIVARYPRLTEDIPADTYGEAESRDRLARAQRVVEWAEKVIDDTLDS